MSVPPADDAADLYPLLVMPGILSAAPRVLSTESPPIELSLLYPDFCRRFAVVLLTVGGSERLLRRGTVLVGNSSSSALSAVPVAGGVDRVGGGVGGVEPPFASSSICSAVSPCGAGAAG